MNAKPFNVLKESELYQSAPALYTALRKITEAHCKTCHALKDVGCVSSANCLYKFGREAIEQAGGYS